ncbi:hypothetical protein FRC08_004951 [Ceratobasidium sp. 394]|nr:hypothetical protein FRC08_004951 [Ceratobasidium sp. 394]
MPAETIDVKMLFLQYFIAWGTCFAHHALSCSRVLTGVGLPLVTSLKSQQLDRSFRESPTYRFSPARMHSYKYSAELCLDIYTTKFPPRSAILMLPGFKLPYLPSDVWTIILRWVVSTNSTVDLKTISLLSRSIGYEADRYLWGNLTVESSHALVMLSKLILGHDRISRHLCSLCVIAAPRNQVVLSPPDISLIKQAFARCAKLGALKLWLGTESMSCIDSLHVPALHTFSTDLAIDAHVFAFLSQHPGIQELHLGGDLAGGTDFVPTYLLPNLCTLEAPLPLATTLVPYRPVSRLKLWASYDQPPDVAVAEALRQTECMRLSTTSIISFRFEDGPPYAPAIHKHGASCFYHLRLLGLLFIDREEEDQIFELVHLTPNLEVLQIDNAMANRRGTSEQRDFAFRLGCVFKSLKLVSFEDDYQNMHWGRVGVLKNNKWVRHEGVPLSLWRDI